MVFNCQNGMVLNEFVLLNLLWQCEHMWKNWANIQQCKKKVIAGTCCVDLFEIWALVLVWLSLNKGGTM